MKQWFDLRLNLRWGRRRIWCVQPEKCKHTSKLFKFTEEWRHGNDFIKVRARYETLLQISSLEWPLGEIVSHSLRLREHPVLKEGEQTSHEGNRFRTRHSYVQRWELRRNTGADESYQTNSVLSEVGTVEDSNVMRLETPYSPTHAQCALELASYVLSMAE